MLHFAPQSIGKTVGYAFYIWLSVFNMFVVSVFWGFMADGFSFEQSRRLYGLIGVGGTLGAFTGATLTGWLVHHVSPAGLMLLALAMLEAATGCTYLLGRCFDRMPAHGVGRCRPGSAPPPAGESVRSPDLTVAGIQPGSLSGIRALVRSPFLLMICLYILLIAVFSTFLYFVQARIVSEATASRAEQTALFARMDAWTQIITLLAQTLITARVLRRGAGAALVFYPLLTIAGFAALTVAPTLGVLVVFQVLHRATRYGLASPARESLFTVLTRDEKYKVKCFIDTFVYRGGDFIGALVDRSIALAGLALGGILVLSLPLVAAWVAIAAMLGRMQWAKAHGRPSRNAGPVAAPTA